MFRFNLDLDKIMKKILKKNSFIKIDEFKEKRKKTK